LDKVVERGKVATLPFQSKRDAWRWRAEAYAFRQLIRKLEGQTPYDHLKLVISPAAPTEVRIEALRTRPVDVRFGEEDLGEMILTEPAQVMKAKSVLDEKLAVMVRAKIPPMTIWTSLNMMAHDERAVREAFEKAGYPVPVGEGDLIE
jgi:hypothetical protein